jgi:glyoxylase-like metal-dependent hydrolase (beta-lactamase superfamily II)
VTVAQFRSADHPFTAWTSWDPDLPAERINDRILMSRSNSNSYLIETDDGDVVINTGTAYQGERHRERYEELLGRQLNVRKIILGQCHPDHVGGWAAFNGPGVETIAHKAFPEGRRTRKRLAGFFRPRSTRIMGRKIGLSDETRRLAYYDTPEPEITTLVDDSMTFDLGGTRFEMYSVPGGETLDCLAVFLPDERAVFTMNLFGALFPQIPHLSTIRGDELRNALLYVESVNRVLALEPELLITGHNVPIETAETIRFELERLRDGAQYVHDETVQGMTEGKDLWTLMREIELPKHLQVGPNRGPLSWSVRGVWERYAGWFRFESTTELYGVPPRAIWSELASLAGGPKVLAERAAAHVAAGEPVEALHFADIALSVEPANREALSAQIDALELLVQRTGGDEFDLLAYLESELIDARAALGSA